MNQIPVDYRFTNTEREEIYKILSEIRTNPYKDYDGFSIEVDKLLKKYNISPALKKICEYKRSINSFDDPYVLLKNCPIDKDLPFLDFEEPVLDKRNRKKTYVSEAFLLIYAIYMKQEPIGYINVNDGDIFQDIHPKKNLINSQSQKALKPIFFHKDLANHFVRPDWVNIIGLRSNLKNEVYTSFVSNKQLLDGLDDTILENLRRFEFQTPYDDLSKYKSHVKLGEPDIHPILGGATPTDIRLFENRTFALTPRAEVALKTILDKLHQIKIRLQIGAGDFIGSANNDCLHCKEVLFVEDEESLQNRWLMKTVNVKSLQQHKQHFLENKTRTVNG